MLVCTTVPSGYSQVWATQCWDIFIKSFSTLYLMFCCVVWDKIRNEKNKEKWLSANDEEYEDRDGNVFNKKTYEDLKRQGLL